MLVLFFGIAALVGTVVLGAYAGESWLYCWEGVGEIREDQGEKRGHAAHVPRPALAQETEEAFGRPAQAFGECVAS